MQLDRGRLRYPPLIRESMVGARCRVRTCDPIRVKDVLYH
jgi:hypothetical protein